MIPKVNLKKNIRTLSFVVDLLWNEMHFKRRFGPVLWHPYFFWHNPSVIAALPFSSILYYFPICIFSSEKFSLHLIVQLSAHACNSWTIIIMFVYGVLLIIFFFQICSRLQSYYWHYVFCSLVLITLLLWRWIYSTWIVKFWKRPMISLSSVEDQQVNCSWTIYVH